MNKQQRIAAALAAGQSYLNTGRLPKDAKLLGRGSFAAVLAVHGFAVKVHGKGRDTNPRNRKPRSYSMSLLDSESARYLRAIRDGELTGKHFPKVYALEEADEGRFVAVMEQLQPGRTAWLHVKEAQYSYEGDSGYGVRKPKQQATLKRAWRQLDEVGFWADDIYSGNVMKRGDTIVLTDVVM